MGFQLKGVKGGKPPFLLSIPFMGFTRRTKSCRTRKTFTFNSLYAIQTEAIEAVEEIDLTFQFPLWDSFVFSLLYSILFDYFQFPLWDSIIISYNVAS